MQVTIDVSLASGEKVFERPLPAVPFSHVGGQVAVGQSGHPGPQRRALRTRWPSKVRSGDEELGKVTGRLISAPGVRAWARQIEEQAEELAAGGQEAAQSPHYAVAKLKLEKAGQMLDRTYLRGSTVSRAVDELVGATEAVEVLAGNEGGHPSGTGNSSWHTSPRSTIRRSPTWSTCRRTTSHPPWGSLAAIRSS